MRRGQLYHDYTPNVSFSPHVRSQKALVPGEIQKPTLQKKTVDEKMEEEHKEESKKKTAYDVLVDETSKDERDNYEEDESAAKRQEIMEAIDIMKQAGDMESASKLEQLLKEFEDEQDARLQEEEGYLTDEEESVADNPPLESKSVKDLLADLDEVENEEDEVKAGVASNVTSKLTSTFQKNMEGLGGAKQVMDPIDMHEYAKLVNASYQFFEHRDFNKTREYMSSPENAYIPNFNQWQVSETYSSPDNMVFVKYGRDLNNPTVVIACRGTATASDWGANVNMVLGGTEQIQRFKDLEDTLHKLKGQFPTANIQVTGHSQGGGLSYALAQKYNLKGYHFDPAVFPSFRNGVVKQTMTTWGTSPLSNLTGNMMRYDSHSSRQVQRVYKNGIDPVSMMMSLLDTEKNVRVRNVDVKSTSQTAISSPHSLSNYYLDGYDGDVRNGVPVMRGGNTRKILEPVLKRAAASTAVRKTGKLGGGIAVGLTLNDTYHALKRMEQDTSLSASEKRTKQWLRTGKNVADFAVAAGAGMSAEAAAASMLAGMGATGAVAVGAPLLMGAAAALVASEAVRWIGGSLEKHASKLSRFVDPQLVDVANVPRRKKRKISG